ncbi:AMP-dependent synthetase [Cellulomonas sp. APG4]|uniref:AMP-dependent synthetase n=1 Tax=Cellulomonas sp. APG4 TaxID=1538656 RepID=UPI00137A0DEC|nr:AMP-dependent synthetase [Cellulomonas sp. APG4]NCT90159.1 AMP-dependent synthetase [Cellulomonas sp. APG4]
MTEPTHARGASEQPPADQAPPERAPVEHVLDEYQPMSALALDDVARWPTLDTAGARVLTAVTSDPSAPTWVHRTGDRLTSDDLAALRGAPRRHAAAPGPDAGAPPAWVDALVARAHEQVPRYRRRAREGRSSGTTPLTALPTLDRDDLRGGVADLVPLDVALDRVLEGTSSGSTGAALRIPLHPVTVAADLLLLHRLMGDAGVAWHAEPDRLGLVNLVDQRAAFTYASAMTAFPRPDEVAAPVMARVNLDDAAWNAPGDRERFLAAWDPQVVSTSPLPLVRLVELVRAGLVLHPLALVSGAAHLTPAVRALVGETWDVPLLDLYGLRETGPVAARWDDGPHVVLPRRVWVEVLDADGVPCPDGVRGEIAVTTDENPYLPLLRYRTGDHGSLRRRADGTVEVHGLEGRAPVRYQHADGSWRPSVDATQVLQGHGLAAWELHQDAAGAVHLTALPASPGTPAGLTAARQAGQALERLLGRPVGLDVLADSARFGGLKPRRFSSALDPLSRDAPT